MITLPEPQMRGAVSLEEAIQKRRSAREFSDKELNAAEISQLVWSAQGITDKKNGFRSVPSAGALYPLEIYLVKRDGVYHYIPKRHALELLDKADMRSVLSQACLDQAMVKEAPVCLVVCAVFERVTSKYGERGRRYVYMEAGHCAQNIHLEAVSLGLASCPVGAFHDTEIKALLKLPEETDPLYIIPVGAQEQ